MKRLRTGMSPQTLRVIRSAARGGFRVLLLLGSPFLYELLGRGAEWIWGFLDLSWNQWEALLWFR